MPGVIYYTDDDQFSGAAADINGTTTTNGNTWVAPSSNTQRILQTGAGAVSAGLNPPVDATAFYRLSLTDAALANLTPEDSLNQLIRVDINPLAGTPARIWQWVALAGIDPVSFAGRGVGVLSDNFPTVSTTTYRAYATAIRSGGRFFSDEEFETVAVATFASTIGTVQILVRVDPYQVLGQVIYASRSWFSFDYDMSFLNEGISTVRTVGLMAFDFFGDVNAPEVDFFQYRLYRMTPMQIVPTWREWGSTLVAETGELDFGAPQLSGGVHNLNFVGGYNVLIPHRQADRFVAAHMLQLDNRQNAAVVDVFVGPFRWRASPGSEMEIPLDPALNRDRILIRGGGSRARLRILGTAVPTTFRQ